MKSSLHKKRHFFTLLEVLVSMGVFTILMLALMQFFSAAQTVWEKSGNRTETYESARMVCQMLKEDLSAAFYGDADLDMENHYLFDYTEDSTTEKQFSFGTDRNEGLTMVNYHYYPVNSSTTAKAGTLQIQTTVDTDSSNWLSKAGNGLIAFRKPSEETELLTNVIYFDVKTRIWKTKDSGTELELQPFKVHPKESEINEVENKDKSIQKRPPPQVYITIGVISEDALEKIGRMKATDPITDLSSTDNRKAALTEANTYFSEVFEIDSTSGLIKLKADALNEGSNLPQRRLLLEGTQFFNVLVHIDR